MDLKGKKTPESMAANAHDVLCHPANSVQPASEVHFLGLLT